MTNIQIYLHPLAISIILVPEVAGVAFARTRAAGITADLDLEGKGGVGAYFFPNCFTFVSDGGWGEDYQYNRVYQYKDIPLMLAWLQQQKLENPWENYDRN